MVKLYELLKKVPSIIEIPTHKALNEEVKGISTNSHSCKQEEIFIGMPGTRVDGGEFWQSAIKAGAV
ncbi:MAG: Mur ligase domain-containing protein, partial [Candidatus Atelocyanobacterium sp. ALOHA_A2.5_9]|nr:Mur ligase domain-containing protein [Candidatus Atelocyanobacterium sp. ALOHA_A2.5_9]